VSKSACFITGALDSATAVKDFLVGVHQGMNHAIISTGEAVRTIYNNPTLITNLSNNAMRLLTGRPDQIVNAARNALTSVGNSILKFELTMKYGSAADRGFAAGEFTGNLLIALAGGEALGAAKLGIELIASDLVGTTASGEVGTNITRRIRTSPELAPQIKSPETLLPHEGITLDSVKLKILSFAERLGIIDSGGIKGFLDTFNKIAGNEIGAIGDIEKVVEKLKGARGLKGRDFEQYLVEKIGGGEPFKLGGREFDGKLGNLWYEAKTGRFWEDLPKFKADMGQRLDIAQKNGASYHLFSNQTIPQEVKDWLTKKGITFLEILE